MTETSRQVAGGTSRPRGPSQQMPLWKQPFPDTLQVCSETLIGNDQIRGVSGGQRKRVTTGELLVSPKKTLFLDEISTGLDSATTFQIMRTLRHFAHLRQATMLIALLQPTPETYHLFDDIMLLSEGESLVVD